jgi:hypothetical protein
MDLFCFNEKRERSDEIEKKMDGRCGFGLELKMLHPILHIFVVIHEPNESMRFCIATHERRKIERMKGQRPSKVLHGFEFGFNANAVRN